MRRNHVSRLSLLLVIVLIAGGCTLRQETKTEKMYILGGALRKVSDSVEATVRYEDPPNPCKSTINIAEVCPEPEPR